MNIAGAVAEHAAYIGHTQEDAEEGIDHRHFNGRPDRLPVSRATSLPSKKDSPVQFSNKKNAILGRIVPLSLVPISTSNAMLVMSSKLKLSSTKDPDCYFPLPEYMIITGIVSLSLVIMGVISRHILDWILTFHKVSPAHARLVDLLEVLGKVLAMLQAGLLFAGTLLLVPQYPKIVTQLPAQGEKKDEFYCDFQLVVFSTVYLISTWVILFFGLLSYTYVFFHPYIIHMCCRKEVKSEELKRGIPNAASRPPNSSR